MLLSFNNTPDTEEWITESENMENIIYPKKKHYQKNMQYRLL